MSATEIIQEIENLPPSEKAQMVDWFSNDFDRLEAFFAWCDSLPRKVEMTEEEILALPRMIPKRDRPL